MVLLSPACYLFKIIYSELGQVQPQLVMSVLTVRLYLLYKYLRAACLVDNTFSRCFATHNILPSGQIGDVVAAGDVLGEADLGDDRG